MLSRKSVMLPCPAVQFLSGLWVTVALCIAVCVLLCCSHLDLTGSIENETAAGTIPREMPNSLHLHDSLQQTQPSWGSVRLCYYVLPTTNSSDELQPEAVDPLLCSHLVAVAEGSRILNDTIELGWPGQAELLQRVVALKARSPSLRVLFSLMQGFPQLVSNHTAMVSFAYKARMFVEAHGLDGLDLDWEFPTWSPDPRTGERARFVTLLDQLSTALRLVQPSYLVTVAVTGLQPYLDGSYDLPGLARNADFLSLMGYDYHMYKPYLPFTGHNAPLHPRHDDICHFASLNVEASVAALLQRGLPPSQLLLGLPMYGRTWRLASEQHQRLGALAVGQGFGGGYVSYAGAWAFSHFADVVVMDGEAVAPYAARGADWISYENLHSIAAKVNFAKKAGVAGVMTFQLGCDDWAGVTGSPFPLHALVRRLLCRASGCGAGLHSTAGAVPTASGGPAAARRSSPHTGARGLPSFEA